MGHLLVPIRRPGVPLEVERMGCDRDCELSSRVRLVREPGSAAASCICGNRTSLENIPGTLCHVQFYTRRHFFLLDDVRQFLSNRYCEPRWFDRSPCIGTLCDIDCASYRTIYQNANDRKPNPSID